jgi:hypothetical protein
MEKRRQDRTDAPGTRANIRSALHPKHLPTRSVLNTPPRHHQRLLMLPTVMKMTMMLLLWQKRSFEWKPK